MKGDYKKSKKKKSGGEQVSREEVVRLKRKVEKIINGEREKE